jgi:hypothetical protein
VLRSAGAYTVTWSGPRNRVFVIIMNLTYGLCNNNNNNNNNKQTGRLTVGRKMILTCMFTGPLLSTAVSSGSTTRAC